MTTVLAPTNALPHSQRLRFIRSMKKLGDLITETSLSLEAPSHTRAASLSLSPTMHSPNGLAEAPHTSTPTGSRTFFSLRLPNSPLSPSFLNVSRPETPITPLTPVVDPETLKERKLAKVNATLGENVPPELVFPRPSTSSSSSSTSTAMPGKGRKRSSTVSVPEHSSAPSSFSHAALADKSARMSASAGATVVARRRQHQRRPALQHAASSASLRSGPEVPSFAADEPFSYATLVPAPATPSNPAPVSVPVLFDTTRSRATSSAAKKTMYRKEAGWSGEWSGCVRDMDDVVRGLRELRLK